MIKFDMKYLLLALRLTRKREINRKAYKG